MADRWLGSNVRVSVGGRCGVLPWASVIAYRGGGLGGRLKFVSRDEEGVLVSGSQERVSMYLFGRLHRHRRRVSLYGSLDLHLLRLRHRRVSLGCSRAGCRVRGREDCLWRLNRPF